MIIYLGEWKSDIYQPLSHHVTKYNHLHNQQTYPSVAHQAEVEKFVTGKERSTQPSFLLPTTKKWDGKGSPQYPVSINDLRFHFILEQCINPDHNFVCREELHRFGSNSISNLRYNFYCNWAKREKATWDWKCNTQINIVCNKNILNQS